MTAFLNIDVLAKMEDLNNILSDQSLLFSFTELMSPTQKNAVDFWCDTNRFLEYASCTDPVVANNMAQNICQTYKDKEGIPSGVVECLVEHLEGKFGDLETNIQFIKDCKEDIFTYILLQLYPDYKEHALAPNATPRISLNETKGDPFENFTEDSIRTMETEKGNMIVAATIPRAMALLTGDVSGM